MKKLSLLIPRYKEDKRLVKRLLDSIALQQQVDFNEIEVIVANDGDEYLLDDEMFKGYEFDIDYIICPKKGVSATRNAALSRANGKYVQFCDADDMFVSVLALYIIFCEINFGDFDAIICNFLQETKMPDGHINYIEMPMNMNFVHGKVLRKKFLDDNKIYFNEKSNIHEDFPLMALAKAYTQNIKYCQLAVYGWMWNDNSVCRRDPLYLQKTTKNLLLNASYVIQHLLERGRNDIARETAFSMIMDIYYSLNAKAWLDFANKKWRDETEGYFKHFYESYKDLADALSEEHKNAIIAGQKQMHTQQGILLEDVTYKDWINHIESDSVKIIEFEL